MTSYRLDNEIAVAMAAIPQEAPELPAGDWRALRTRIDEEYADLLAITPPAPGDVTRETIRFISESGDELVARWYTRGDDRPGSAVVYAHGGGMVGGALDHYDQLLATYVSQTGVPFLSVDYRLSPEGRDAQPSEDLLSGLHWLRGHADELSADLTRIALMGDSAGGGIAASAAILARDRGLPVAHQILIYPMLDDRVRTCSPAIQPFLTWTPEMNATGWDARIKGAITPATSPARLDDHRHLAPAYIEVGDLDLFRDENLAYAQRLAAADVPLELHIHPSVPHGYDMMCPEANITRRVLQDRARVLLAL